MENFEIRDLEIIKNLNLPQSTLKRQVNNMLCSSQNCKLTVECINQDTGEYRIVLQGILESDFTTH
jgi:hypothetical protein